MLEEDSVRRLRCPVTLGRLTPADDELIARVNRMIEAGGLPTRSGQPQNGCVQGGLITDDRCHLYPIRDGIVCLLAESAIELELVNDAPR